MTTGGAAPPTGPVAVDALAVLASASGRGVYWTLPEPSDLNVNVVRLGPGESIAEHVNEDTDVVLVPLAGEGELLVETTRVALHPGVVAHVPRRARRTLTSGPVALAYLTIHRRRTGPTISKRA